MIKDVARNNTFANLSKFKLRKPMHEPPLVKLEIPSQKFTNNLIRLYKLRLSKCVAP
jgi:hypothetical protein